MKNTPIIQMPQEQAKLLYKDYLKVVKTRKEKYLEQLKKVYYHLSKGNKVLDIFEVFKTSGINEEGEPKLAIAPANETLVHFRKSPLGAGRFSPHSNPQWDKSSASYVVDLPSNSFPEWKAKKAPIKYDPDREEIIRETIRTKVPIVPGHLLPEGKLDNYFILWECGGWEDMPTFADPFLLKRINSNAFVMLAEWDLTEVEQAVIRGL